MKRETNLPTNYSRATKASVANQQPPIKNVYVV